MLFIQLHVFFILLPVQCAYVINISQFQLAYCIWCTALAPPCETSLHYQWKIFTSSKQNHFVWPCILSASGKIEQSANPHVPVSPHVLVLRSGRCFRKLRFYRKCSTQSYNASNCAQFHIRLASEATLRLKESKRKCFRLKNVSIEKQR